MIAKIAFPIAISGIFDYKIPDEFRSQISPGLPVKVELRNRKIWGVVVEIAEWSAIKKLKEIIEIKAHYLNDSSESLIALYKWIATYYQSELGKVFKPLIRKRFVDIAPRTITVYRFSGNIPDKLTKKQQSASEKLSILKGEITRILLQKEYALSDHLISALTARGVLIKSKIQVLREGAELEQRREKNSIVLTDEQLSIVEKVWAGREKNLKPFLLFGITGSGKTHVYIELVKRTLEIGKGVIILVPEISLTAQTIKRFRDAIGSDIAVIHSRMSDGERRDSVEELVSGRKRIVIGARSAILVPMDNVGLIVVDEEHDGSYKQSDPEPRYNARDVAVMRGNLQKSLVVLGSATPSFESYYNARNEKYTLVTLMKRFGRATLPQVEIVDMNLEHTRNNWTFLSQYLKDKIQETLDSKRQVILLLNRRGFSVMLICTSCGHIYKCPNCSVNLIYHRVSMDLKCHQCGWAESAPATCLKCGGEQIKYRGTGIQKVEEFLREVFPEARILRMDQDTTRRKGMHVTILNSYANQEADILLGTQMVAKGLNFPGVKLVGVLQADIGLHFPDFRASERTFQLLTQVAGRAGRKDRLGEVVIQTYSPHEPSIIAAQKHDFLGFYDEEIASRKTLDYPPFRRLIRIIVRGKEEYNVRSTIEKIAGMIRRTTGKSIKILGPSPAVLTRLKNVYRYSLIIKTGFPGSMQKLLSQVKSEFHKLPADLKLIIDVDPINML